MKNIIYVMADPKNPNKKGCDIIPVCRIQMNDDGTAHISFHGFSVHMADPTFDTIIKCITYNSGFIIDKFGKFLYTNDDIKISIEKNTPEKSIVNVLNIFDLYYQFNKAIGLSTKELLDNNFRFANRRLIGYILGTDYYNEGCDAYTCDRLTSFDIIRKFDNLKRQNLVLTIATAALSVSTITVMIIAFMALNF